jgi:signal transduction histidine kinase
MTFGATGFVAYLLLYRSLTTELDRSMVTDARQTLRLLANRPNSSDTTVVKRSVRSRTIREIIDEALLNAPENLSGDEYTDRVMSRVMDEMIFELSDSAADNADRIEGILQRTLTGRKNYQIEVYVITAEPKLLYHTPRSNGATLKSAYQITSFTPSDSLRILGEYEKEDDVLRAVIASNGTYAIIVASSEQEIHEIIGRLLRIYMYIVPLALVIASIGGVILARKALKPIEDIADTAREIGAKNLSRRIEMPSRSDRELMTLVATLNEMFTRLEVSYAQIGQFSSDASHELKTPLAILKGEIEVAMRRLESSGALTITEAKDLLHSMMEEVERMQRIVEGLLLIAKAEDNRLPLQTESVQIADYLRSLAEDAAILAADKGITFIVSIDDDTTNNFVALDTTRMYQVMMNLIDNALKYTASGGTIELFLRKISQTIEFGIRDTGSGIAPDDLPKVFQRFFRSETSRPQTNTDYASRSLGLGLAISKSIVEAHGGAIRVESELNKGTTFTISMPIE